MNKREPILRADLHSHTLYSDGQLSPEELVLRAGQMQVDMLAITDHDCIDGLASAAEAIARYKLNIKLVNGVEVSTRWHGFEIHILGLNIDNKSIALNQGLNLQQQKRQERAVKIAQKLEFLGIEGLLKRAQGSAKTSISRVHFAQVLINAGVCRDQSQAFTKFLAAGKRAYVTPEWMSVAEAIELIKNANGIACLAHPYFYDMKTKWLRRLFDEFSMAGGLAAELYHPRVAPSKLALIEQIAKDKHLFASVGSDFHAPSRWNELGKKLSIPDGFEPVWAHF